MTSQWRTYLNSQNGQFDEQGQLQDFGQPVQEQQQVLQTTVLADLSHYALVQASGKDASQFLQGQFTNDMREVNDTRSQVSSWCSPKGRILVNFRLFKRNDAYYLLLPIDCLAATLKRLQMYVLRSDVKLVDVSDSLVRLGVSGDQSAQLLQMGLGIELPNEDNGCVTVGDVTVLKIAGIMPRYLVIGEPDVLQTFCQQQSMPFVGVKAWGLLDILTGYPQITAATADMFVPQMVNFELIGGVNFKKGCYAGQEIVARLQYLGNLKQRMYLGRIQTDSAPAAGAFLYVAGQEQSIGQLVSAQPHPQGGYAALAVLQIARADAPAIHLGSAEGALFSLEPQPYELNVA